VAIVLAIIARRRIKRDPNRGGGGMAVAALVIGIVLLVGGIALDAAIIASQDDVKFTELKVGDCTKGLGITAPGTKILTVTKQSCSGAHEREVFGVTDDPAPAGSPWPGRDALQKSAEAKCLERFEDYVGTPPARSSLKIELLYPGQATWEKEGTRRLVCIVGNADDSSTTTPFKGSKR